MSAVLTDFECLHAALDENPADQGARLALADIYEERDERLGADALRWMADKGRYPDRPGEALDYEDSGRGPLCPGQWSFWSEIFPHNPTHALVPTDLVVKFWTTDDTRRLLEESLMKAWAESTPEERAEFWDWEPRHVE